jgi:hypothetical protein
MRLGLMSAAIGLPICLAFGSVSGTRSRDRSAHPIRGQQPGSSNQPQFEFDKPPIRYAASLPNDAIAQLQKQIDSGKVKLSFDEKRGFLASVLKTLDIPVSSQMLVFSKTSVQRKLITPQTPRAVYFNDRVYIGWVPNAPGLEVATMDPRLGPVFYVLPQNKTRPPHFLRMNQECLLCHGSVLTGGIPGHLVRSTFTGDDGGVLTNDESYLTSDSSPFDKRYGGWYVTGKSGAQLHMGNYPANEEGAIDRKKASNITALKSIVNTAPYLSQHSDIVALMVLAHQTSLQNLITSAGYRVRIRISEVAASRDKTAPETLESQTETRLEIKRQCEPLVRAMLFSGAVPFSSPITGTSSFAAEFSKQGPKDARGRSLRELDLQRRLFTYPCSYTIYSPAFDALPHVAKEYCYRRLVEVLRGYDQSPEFAHLSKGDREVVLQILMDTKPGFAAWTKDL